MNEKQEASAVARALFEGLQKADPGFWWLSFVNPEDGKFQGAAIVWGSNFDDALRRSRKLKISPGCQVRGKKLPKWGEPEEEFLNRLLSKEEEVGVVRSKSPDNLYDWRIVLRSATNHHLPL